MKEIIYILVCIFCLPAPAVASSELGPMRGEVERVVDGDTVRMRVAIWLDQEIRVAVRLADAYAPEIRRPRCAAEKRQGQSAKAFVEDFLAGRVITLHDIRRGKYAGRVAARIEADGEDLGAALVAAGLADREPKRVWC